MTNYYKPTYKKSEYNCPICNVYAQQYWYRILRYEYCEDHILPSYDNSIYANPNTISYIPPGQTIVVVDDASLSRCFKCNSYSFWIKDKMVYPIVSLAPKPSDDMPEDVKADYMEAASIVEASPRASSALLRLALQKLMPHLGENRDNINDDIGNLVTRGLSKEIQQALDLVRVIGNESVHPGELDLKDNKETAYSLFGLLNFIVYDRITRPKEIDALYCKLPQKKLDGINNRDKP